MTSNVNTIVKYLVMATKNRETCNLTVYYDTRWNATVNRNDANSLEHVYYVNFIYRDGRAGKYEISFDAEGNAQLKNLGKTNIRVKNDVKNKILEVERFYRQYIKVYQTL